MATLVNSDIANFLAFTVGPKADFIYINDLNKIKLSNHDNKDISFFKEAVLSIFNNEIDSYNLADGENIGILLSGGVDSTLLLKLIKERFPKSRLYTYTLGYSKDDNHLESARKISKEFGTTHNEIIFDLESNLFGLLDDVYASGYNLEGEDSLLMNHILAKVVKKDCKVVFSGFGLDYVFAGMDLFMNSHSENLYNKGLVGKRFILETLQGNKYYLKYVLDKIDSRFGEGFFMKYGEYSGGILKSSEEKKVLGFFEKNFSSIRSDISLLKKQIYYIIFTSLSNRYNPYNKPYEIVGVRHFNPFGSRNTIEKVISLNIPDNFLYNPFTQEKKFIIKSIAKELLSEKIIKSLKTGTVLKYDKAFVANRQKILDLVGINKNYLANFLKKEYIENFYKVIENSMWFEESRKIIGVLQLLFFIKHHPVGLKSGSLERYGSQLNSTKATSGKSVPNLSK